MIKQEEDEIETITFKYDPFGRRIEKKITETPSPLAGEGGGEGEAKTYSYVYDNEDIIVEYLVKAEDGKTKTKTTRYLHGTGIDEPLAIEREKETFYYHADGLGSITTLTDARQKEVESYDYTSFGDLKRHGDKVKNTYTFTGREFDEEIDLYYYRARYYDEEIGRFTSFDPILRGFSHIKEASCTKSINRFPLQQPRKLHSFVYVENNPINFSDPLGLVGLCKSGQCKDCPSGDWFGATGAAGGEFIIGSSTVAVTVGCKGGPSCNLILSCKSKGIAFSIGASVGPVNCSGIYCNEDLIKTYQSSLSITIGPFGVPTTTGVGCDGPSFGGGEGGFGIGISKFTCEPMYFSCK